ncbi:hypothetical protein [Pseudomonas parakoreensis]|uniref:hypothetical protein n=1 Tax=Pseudomonas parakoreensis TaxID=2892331 RepID=UPI003FCFF2D1
MKGKFDSYDQTTGKITIVADEETNAAGSPLDSLLESSTLTQWFTKYEFEGEYAELRSQDYEIKTKNEKKKYELIVPEAQRGIINIAPGASVEFELVSEGSMEVKSISY